MPPPIFYLDACAVQRPYDDVRDPLVSAEAACVRYVLSRVATGRASLVWSSALEAECSSPLAPAARRAWGAIVRDLATRNLLVTETTIERAKEIRATTGASAFDALHVACAEELGATLVTADRRLLRRLTRGAPPRVDVIDLFAAAALAKGARA